MEWRWDPEQVWLVVLLLLFTADWIIRIVALFAVPPNRRPQTALAWLLAIFFVPWAGILMFLVFGRARLPRARRLKQREVSEYLRATTEGAGRVRRDTPWPPWLEPLVQLNRTLGSMPLVGGNAARMQTDYDAALAEMIAEIDRATRTVHAEFYILLLDETTEPFFAALERARRRGVNVRVLLDHLGSRRYPGYRRTIRRLDEMGVAWRLMLPFQPLRGRVQRPDLRNHRKLLVVDGEVAFTGSLNIVDPGYQLRRNLRRRLRWLDYWVRFEGPVVAGIDAVFVTDWYCETGELLERDPSVAQRRARGGRLDCQVVPSGPGFEGESNLRLFNSLVYAAQRNVVVTSPYFVPDDSMLTAVTTAAQSGVEVELFVSEIGDKFLVHHAQRSYYEALLRAGVRIWLYEPPNVLHAKHLTIDDEVAVIGSSNMDMRSFSLNLEMSVMVRGTSFLAGLREIEDRYRARSRELTLDEWLARPRHERALDNLARLTAVVQ